ncbi:MAG: YbaK/EbsC family protein [Chloroflexi bacterium]|nr:YbaK/EbsC family protein [Chloroflexota bacterium]
MMNLPAHEHLDKLGIKYERATFSAITEKGAANVANALGFRERQMVKSLIFEVDTGERVMILVGGDQNAVSGNLKKVIGSRNIKMAGFEIVKATTGYEVGSIPPFSWQPEGFRSFIDESLMQEKVLGVGAGVWGNEILIAPQDLVKACNASVVNLARKD